MLIPLPQVLAYATRPVTGVLHLGANVGEEAAAYADAGITRVVWVEALPTTIPQLRANVQPFGHDVIEAAVSDRVGDEVPFYIADNAQSSSLLRPKLHLKVSPDVAFPETCTVTTTTVDALAASHDLSGLTMLNADLQGGELAALCGAEQFLAGVDLLYLEVNTKELYEGCAQLGELDAWLKPRGFRRVELKMAGPHVGWGDSIYLKDSR